MLSNRVWATFTFVCVFVSVVVLWQCSRSSLLCVHGCGVCVLPVQTMRRLQVTEAELERAEERASAAETYVGLSCFSSGVLN